MIFCVPPKRSGHFSSSALCITLSSGWLHSTSAAVRPAHPMGLASSKCWVLLLQLGFTDSLIYAPFMVPSLCRTPSCLQNQYHLGDSYMWPSSAATQGTILAISGTQFLCPLRKHFLEDFTSMMLVSSSSLLISQLQLTSFNFPSSPFYSYL